MKRKTPAERQFEAHCELARKGVSSDIKIRLRDDIYFVSGQEVMHLPLDITAHLRMHGATALKEVGTMVRVDDEMEESIFYAESDGTLWLESPTAWSGVLAVEAATNELLTAVESAAKAGEIRMDGSELAQVEHFIRDRSALYSIGNGGHLLQKCNRPHYELCFQGAYLKGGSKDWISADFTAVADSSGLSGGGWVSDILRFRHDERDQVIAVKEHFSDSAPVSYGDDYIKLRLPEEPLVDDFLLGAAIYFSNRLVSSAFPSHETVKLAHDFAAAVDADFRDALPSPSSFEALERLEARLAEEGDGFAQFLDEEGWPFTISPVDILKSRIAVRFGLDFERTFGPSATM